MRAIHNSLVQDRTGHYWPSHIVTFSIKASTFIMLFYSMGASAVSLLISPPLTLSVDSDKASPYELFLPNSFAHDDLSIHLPDSEHSIVHTDRQSHLCLPVECFPFGAEGTFYVLSLAECGRKRSFVHWHRLKTKTWSSKSEPKHQICRMCRAP